MTFNPADILIPKTDDMTLWSVVACDQYTSEPEYWDEVEKITSGKPSAYHIVLPELYLDMDGVDERIRKINETMLSYCNSDLFKEYKSSYIYIERTQKNGKVRKGIIGAVDLEDYDMFITDFSSFVFDYGYLNRPVLYFVPDYNEFKSGMGHYRELDLPFEDAFGPLTTDADSAVKEILKVAANNFVPEEVYGKRMEEFYVPMNGDCCENLYKYVMENMFKEGLYDYNPEDDEEEEYIVDDELISSVTDDRYEDEEFDNDKFDGSSDDDEDDEDDEDGDNDREDDDEDGDDEEDDD